MTFVTVLFSICAFTQENDLQHFVNEFENEVGVWITDNSEYQNENEPYEQYAVEWKWGLGKKSLIGRLYGIKGGKDIGNFWQFRKYFDPSITKVIVLQFGSDGSFGKGELTHLSDNEIKLEQTFTNPDGSTYKIGHKTTYLDQNKHIGKSFIIDEENNWVANRTYTWIRQQE
ncbi:MAG: hypothetical protein Aureis2KO_26600 [Aureisphaera sp.]